jgi:Dynein heavy chain, N-terminal region 1
LRVFLEPRLILLILQGVPEASAAGRVTVNFSPQLTFLIHETRCLDALGFVAPEVALSIALQDDKYRRTREALSKMLGSYYQATWRLFDVVWKGQTSKWMDNQTVWWTIRTIRIRTQTDQWPDRPADERVEMDRQMGDE